MKDTLLYFFMAMCRGNEIAADSCPNQNSGEGDEECDWLSCPSSRRIGHSREPLPAWGMGA